MVKLHRFLFVLACLFVSQALAQDTRPPASYWLEIEPKQGPRFVKEMIVARLHVRYVRPVALVRPKPYETPDFELLKLGHGKVFTATDDGFRTPAIEETIALFPKRSGVLTLPSFEQELTYIDRAGKRVQIALKTEPVELEIEPAPVADGVWWLPARAVTVQDEWSADPSDLPPGEPVRRTITVTAAAQLPTSLPPAPGSTTQGLIVSAASPQRSMAIGLPVEDKQRQRPNAKGRPMEYVESDRPQPISSVSYSWLIRPTTGDPVTMPELTLHWFDIDKGEPQAIVLPARTVAFRDPGPALEEMEAALGLQPVPPIRADRLLVANAILAGLLFLATFAATASLLSSEFRTAALQAIRWTRLRIARQRMMDAAARGDAPGIWKRYSTMVKSGLAGEPGDQASLRRLEGVVFGGQNLPKAQLRTIARDLAKALAAPAVDSRSHG